MSWCWVREAQKRLAEVDEIGTLRIRCLPHGAARDAVSEAQVSVACQRAALRVRRCSGGG